MFIEVQRNFALHLGRYVGYLLSWHGEEDVAQNETMRIEKVKL